MYTQYVIIRKKINKGSSAVIKATLFNESTMITEISCRKRVGSAMKSESGRWP